MEGAQHVAWIAVLHFGAAEMLVDQTVFFPAAERTQRRQRLGRAILAWLGPLPANDDRAHQGLLLGTQPRAVQHGEQGRHDSSTAKALLQRHAPPLPRPRRLLELSVHAERADLSRINDAAIMHAPQERVTLEDRPVRAFEGCHSCTKRAFDTAARAGVARRTLPW